VSARTRGLRVEEVGEVARGQQAVAPPFQLLGRGDLHARLDFRRDGAESATHEAQQQCGLALLDALLDALPAPRVAIHAGAGSFSLARRWPLEDYARLVQRLTAHLDVSVVLVGGRDEAGIGAALREAGPPDRILDLTGRTTLGQLGALLARCHLFVGNDSGVMHLAAAVGTDILALFGPSNHRAWGPWTPTARSIIIRADVPCSPCLYRGDTLGTPEGCPARPCLHMITPEQVVSSVEQLLATGAHPAVAGHPDR